MSAITVPKANKNFYNQKFYGVDFSGQDLNHADFRLASVMDCNFSNTDLSYADFEGANCRGANFTASRCYRTNFKDASLAESKFEPKDCFGMTLSMSCETFDGMKVSKIWWYVWLMLALRMHPPEEGMDLKLIDAIGKERYIGLRALFDRRQM